MSDLLRSRQGTDAVLTEVAYSSYQGESLIPFIAPTINVTARSGKIITFGKEQFAVVSTKRAPYAFHKRNNGGTGYSTDLVYVLEQHSHEAEVSWEEIDAANGANCAGPKIDLIEMSVLGAVRTIEQSLEQSLYSLVTNAANYEATNAVTAAGTSQFSNPGSDPEALVMTWKSIVMAQIGKYPTRAVISEDVYRALVLHPVFRDRTKYTTVSSTDLCLLATWLGLPGGIKVADRRKLDLATGNLSPMFPAGTMLLFVDGRDSSSFQGGSSDCDRHAFMPSTTAMATTATFAQLYSLPEGLTVGKTRVIEDNDSIRSTVRFTGSFVLPSVGATNKSSAGIIVSNLI